MEKNRSQIPCFWEAQPTGCSKGNCPFMHVKIKHDPYVPEAVVPATIFPINGGGKIIVNKNRLDQIALSNPEVASVANRTVLPPGGGSARKIPIKQRLGYKMEESNDFDDYSGEIDSEEENLRKGAISTIDLRKRLTSKRRHSSSDGSADIEPEVKIRSVVKKVKKEKKEKKKHKKEKRAKREEIKNNRASKEMSSQILSKSRNNHDFSEDDSENDTLAQRIAAQRDKNKKGAKKSSNDHGSSKKQRGSTPERSVEIVDKKSPNNSDSKTSKKSKAARKTSLNEEKDSVRSVIDDVDALLKSSDHVLPLSDSSAKNDSHDVMKELDELINS